MFLQLAVGCDLLFVCCIDYFGGLFLFTVVWLFDWWFGVWIWWVSGARFVGLHWVTELRCYWWDLVVMFG